MDTSLSLFLVRSSVILRFRSPLTFIDRRAPEVIGPTNFSVLCLTSQTLNSCLELFVEESFPPLNNVVTGVIYRTNKGTRNVTEPSRRVALHFRSRLWNLDVTGTEQDRLSHTTLTVTRSRRTTFRSSSECTSEKEVSGVGKGNSTFGRT